MSEMRTAWVIGASSGIGRELARALAGRGWQVVISARRAEALAALRQEHPAALIDIAFDVLDPAALATALGDVGRRAGKLDLLICSAAFWRMGGLADTEPEDFTRTLQTNVVAPFTIIKRTIEHELLSPGATIAVLSSVAGFNGLPNAVSYGSSKAALTHMAESLRFDLAALGYRMTVVHPGFVDTPMTAANPFPMPFIMPAAEAARRILAGLERGRFEIAFPRRLAWVLKLLRALPYALSYPLLKRLTGSG
ncbi:MAG: SDR family NAD(P)-dependent oxidoreductase [Gammaproteobacteria bacterium]|jgi:NAD(P)-dependent dehydrogenase (short-subunit alcohol dehydrogenase family)